MSKIRIRLKGFLILVPVMVLLAGCELGETLKELAILQDDLETEYGDDGSISVQYSIATGIGKAVQVTLENSSIIAVDDPDAKEATEEMALFVYNHYPDVSSLDSIVIVLIESKNLLVMNYTNTVPYVYNVEDLAAKPEGE